MSKFSENLKNLLHDRKISSSALSRATGIPKSTLSEWLTGTREPTVSEALVKLSQHLGVSLEFLFTGIHPEENLISDIIDTAEEGFTTLHKGLYRIQIEKFSGKKRKGK